MNYFTTSNRLMDTRLSVAPGNYGVHIAKSIFRNHLPYSISGGYNNVYTIDFDFHFIKNLRRVLSGVTGNTQFSKEEQVLYEKYVAYLSEDVEYVGRELAVLDALDSWLVMEVEELPHDEMPRSYSAEVPWV